MMPRKTTPDQPIFAGITTFMRAPYLLNLADLAHFDIAVLGIPLDFGASYREGAKHAPRSIREHSHWDDLDGGEYYDFELEDVLIAHRRSLVDVGDVTVYPTDPDRTNQAIEETVAHVRTSAFPLILGGDHSITYACFKGCLAALRPEQRPLGLLHFDAHLDVEEQFGVMPSVWHGNPFRKLIEEGYLVPNHMVSIGPRGIFPKKWIDFVRQHGIQVSSAQEVGRKGMRQVLEEGTRHLKECCSAVYVTLDIDCLDPSHAPGTGTPAAGGLSAIEMISAVRQLGDLPIVGFDLVEVNPLLDSSGRTSVVACDLLWNFLSFGLTDPQR